MELITSENRNIIKLKINNKYLVNILIINNIYYDYCIYIILCKEIGLNFSRGVTNYHSIIGKYYINKNNIIYKLKLYDNIIIYIYFIYKKYYYNNKNNITIQYLGDYGDKDLILNNDINAIKNILTCKNHKSSIYII